MSSGILSEKLSKLLSSFNTPRRRAILGVILLFLWTKVGVPNLLYVLQYLDCIIKIGVFKKRIKYAATTAIYKTRVHIYDIDWWLHMNNAAYLRHAELARVDYFLRSNLRNELKRKGFRIAFVALNIRYRRELRVFKSYRIETRPIFWDELQLIIEQRFVNPETDFVHTIIYGKYVLVKNGRKVRQSMNDLVPEGIHTVQFYEHSAMMDGSPTGSMPRQIASVASCDSLSSMNGISKDTIGQYDDAEDSSAFRNYHNTYQCRNEIPKSLKLWMQSLEQSSNESRMNLLAPSS